MKICHLHLGGSIIFRPENACFQKPEPANHALCPSICHSKMTLAYQSGTQGFDFVTQNFLAGLDVDLRHVRCRVFHIYKKDNNTTRMCYCHSRNKRLGSVGPWTPSKCYFQKYLLILARWESENFKRSKGRRTLEVGDEWDQWTRILKMWGRRMVLTLRNFV